MRGLKQEKAALTAALAAVARFTRAWIETRIPIRIECKARVARFTRAWIETGYSHVLGETKIVARFTRAWIETPIPSK